ncbi:hypothetical protein CCACVL1_24859 [Corchorus capsularis]|uniref:Uncharacterized protein n=1 Tax=Corchorus capsularis TaxID=210143 RepID=A0A1R3GMQ8_COCAP|nr:hypothetical protein CCACVL1_24859 [Corchorus capsularis]
MAVISSRGIECNGRMRSSKGTA